jgi:dephospho-CoA kinase
MRVIGLTGGIASGKSTVARFFAELGVPVVDADQLARQVVEPGSDALAEIARTFGEDVLLDSGELDRKALGAIVFADPEARKKLNAITHPRIAAAGQEALRRHAEAGCDLAIYEAALIVENGLHRAMQGLIVVSLPESEQLERLQARDGIDAEAARERLAAQASLAEKLEAADYVIDNSGALEDTRAQVVALLQRLRSETK